MIQLAGRPFQLNGMWPADNIEDVIIQRMQEDPTVYSYSSIDELAFELKLRKNIIASARAMNQGHAQFQPFATSRCNPDYWHLTSTGGFQLRYDVTPAEGIQDIYKNSSLYAFECATAKVIIYYHAVLNSIGEYLFNRFFQNLHLYSWHFDSDLGIQTTYTDYFLPGDVVYFNNPDFNPETPWWRGENAVVLEDGTYFGHGLGIKTAEQMINLLNRQRAPWGNQSAYLSNSVTRLSFKHLARLSMTRTDNMACKIPHVVILHNQSSISFNHYWFYLHHFYTQITNSPPFPS